MSVLTKAVHPTFSKANVCFHIYINNTNVIWNLSIVDEFGNVSKYVTAIEQLEVVDKILFKISSFPNMVELSHHITLGVFLTHIHHMLENTLYHRIRSGCLLFCGNFEVLDTTQTLSKLWHSQILEGKMDHEFGILCFNKHFAAYQARQQIIFRSLSFVFPKGVLIDSVTFDVDDLIKQWRFTIYTKYVNTLTMMTFIAKCFMHHEPHFSFCMNLTPPSASSVHSVHSVHSRFELRCNSKKTGQTGQSYIYLINQLDSYTLYLLQNFSQSSFWSDSHSCIIIDSNEFDFTKALTNNTSMKELVDFCLILETAFIHFTNNTMTLICNFSSSNCLNLEYECEQLIEASKRILVNNVYKNKCIGLSLGFCSLYDEMNANDDTLVRVTKTLSEHLYPFITHLTWRFTQEEDWIEYFITHKDENNIDVVCDMIDHNQNKKRNIFTCDFQNQNKKRIKTI